MARALFGPTISEGAISNAFSRMQSGLDEARAAIKEKLQAARIIASDETTTRYTKSPPAGAERRLDALVGVPVVAPPSRWGRSPAPDQGVAHQILRLHDQSRRTGKQHHLRTGNLALRRLPQGHKRLPIRMAQKFMLHNRHSPVARPSRAGDCARFPRRKPRLRLTQKLPTP